MVGIVIVSHSADLAEGVAKLAREMAGPEVRIELAGGLDEPGTLGTDAVRVQAAIEHADSGDGVLVLMDLGSAVLSAELALDMLEPGQRARVILSEAALVEGAVAAVVAARLGSPLEAVAAESRGGLAAKAAHLGAEPAADLEQVVPAPGELTLRLFVTNPLGLHARPAARFVRTVGRFDAEVAVTNLTTGRGPAPARSLNALATLGVRHGHEILVAADGPQAQAAVTALQQLADRNFGDEPAPVPAPPQPPAAGRLEPGDGRLVGHAGAPGIALGPARHFRAPEVEFSAEPAADPASELAALDEALAHVRDELHVVRGLVTARDREDEAAIFDVHLLILEDEAMLAPARQAITQQARNAADAWHAAAEAVATEWDGLEDEYQRARAEDVRAVARMVLARLVGSDAARLSLTAPGILVAPDLTPAQTAALDPALVQGIATAYGGPTSHSSILARALGLPAAVGLGEGVLALAEGTPLLLDGGAGTVVANPDDELVAVFEDRRSREAEKLVAARRGAHQPAVTLDGRRVEVAANVGSPADAAAAAASGADGVGLLRTEFLFLGRDSLPEEDVQVAAYREIAELLRGRPVILRTLDVGADKPLPYLPRPSEANPFLGVRGIRLGLAEPELLAAQLRAVLRVAAEHPLKVMFPMVATLDEFREARGVLERERERLGVRAPLEIGVMIEVPAAALAAEAFSPEVDFFSIGTNDLAQYTMAAERGNERVAALGDALQPAVLRLVRAVVEAAEAFERWVGVCGEIASDLAAVPVLVGLGVAELSVAPPAVPAVKQAVRALDARAAEALAERALSLSSAAEVRALVAEERTVEAMGGAGR
jgi:multiphosphoryl transfer protein